MARATYFSCSSNNKWQPQLLPPVVVAVVVVVIASCIFAMLFFQLFLYVFGCTNKLHINRWPHKFYMLPACRLKNKSKLCVRCKHKLYQRQRGKQQGERRRVGRGEGQCYYYENVAIKIFVRLTNFLNYKKKKNLIANARN